jgi:hypothetical protein
VCSASKSIVACMMATVDPYRQLDHAEQLSRASKTIYELEDAFCAKLEVVGNGRTRQGCSIAAVVDCIKLRGRKVLYETRMKPIELLG